MTSGMLDKTLVSRSQGLFVADSTLPQPPNQSDTPTGDERLAWEAAIRVPRLFKAVRELNMIVEQIINLANPVQEEEDEPRPTPFALATVLRLLSDAGIAMALNAMAQTSGPFHFPGAHVLVDEDGGFRVEWSKGEASVRLVVPSGNVRTECYIYHEVGDDFNVDRGNMATGVRLARWLQLVT